MSAMNARVKPMHVQFRLAAVQRGVVRRCGEGVLVEVAAGGNAPRVDKFHACESQAASSCPGRKHVSWTPVRAVRADANMVSAMAAMDSQRRA